MKKNSWITVKLVGGLGNQLFGLSAGLAQAKRLGCDLRLDISSYERDTLRKFELLPILEKSPNISFVRSESILRKLKNRFLNLRFKELSFEYDSRIESVTPGMVLEGYFQSPQYFCGVESEIVRLISSIDLDSRTQMWINENSRAPFTSIHVRRGDYLTKSALEKHGLASNSYFGDALIKLQNLGCPLRTLVFSDSIELVKNEFAGMENLEFIESEEIKDPWAHILLLAKSEGLVISNSTFSWWAAWLAEQSKPIPIVAPEAWFASGETSQSLLPSSWIKI